MRSIKLWWLLAAFLSGMVFAMWAEELILHSRANHLEFSTPVHFLSGPSLARLRNADEVPFDFQATLWAGSRNHLFRHAEDRFIVSYDLWEEKFAVVKTQAPRKSAAHLSAAAAEAWCMSQMSMDETGLSPTEPLWARLDIRAQESPKSPGRDGGLFGRDGSAEPGISLTGLIDIFSRPAKSQQPHWTLEAGPFTLDQLARSQRGS